MALNNETTGASKVPTEGDMTDFIDGPSIAIDHSLLCSMVGQAPAGDDC